MKIFNFAKRNFKEIIRDPLSIIFAILLPVFLLFIFEQFDIPNEAYYIENFTPGIVIFGLSFISMFTATLVARDRAESLLIRLGVSPMRSYDYVLGYALAVLPLVLIQNVLFFGVALALGLKFSYKILLVIFASLIISALFIGLGILIGSVTNEKSSAGVSSVVVQLVAFTSGMYFDKALVGKFFQAVCDALPFSGALGILKALLNGGGNIFTYILVPAIYTVAVGALSVIIFKKNMHSRH